MAERTRAALPALAAALTSALTLAGALAVAVPLAVLLAIMVPRPAAALETVTYGGFAEAVALFRDEYLAYCRAFAPNVLDATGVYGSLDDPDSFRRACGQGLHGRAIPYHDWEHYYQIDSAPEGAPSQGTLEVFGVARELTFEGRPYLLAIGWQTRTERPHQAPERQDALAVATLFQREVKPGPARWYPLWAYFNPIARDWNEPSGWPQDYPSAPPAQIRWIRTVWQQHVIQDFRRLVWSIRDRRCGTRRGAVCGP